MTNSERRRNDLFINEPAILIPSFQPSNVLVKLVQNLRHRGCCNICVVDDGSGSDFLPIFSAVEAEGCSLVRHEQNRGKGAALKSGIAALRQGNPTLSGVVTADGDGQHTPEDIARVARALTQSPNSLVLGIRDFRSQNVPIKSRFGNHFSSAYFRLTTGTSCPDTQTGLRGIPNCLFSLALSTSGDRYEYEMQFLTAVVQERRTIRFLPIQTVYLNRNTASHFRPIADSIRIYRTPLRYVSSSLLCAGVDVGLFTLLAETLPNGIWSRVLVATAAARVTSGLVNFSLNRRWAFQSRKARGQAGKYAALFLFQMGMSSLLVSCLSRLPLPLTLIKILVDCVLFLFSYLAQRNWVFRPKFTEEKER